MNDWKKLNGEMIEDPKKLIQDLLSGGQRIIHVGCDSQQKKLMTEFVTVIVILEKGNGGRILWKSEKVSKINNLRERLLMEVSRSIMTAFWLNEFIPVEVDLRLHVDANPNIKFKSSNYIQELVGYIVGCGFDACTKPESWAACSVADYVIKKRSEFTGKIIEEK